MDFSRPLQHCSSYLCNVVEYVRSAPRERWMAAFMNEYSVSSSQSIQPQSEEQKKGNHSVLFQVLDFLEPCLSVSNFTYGFTTEEAFTQSGFRR